MKQALDTVFVSFLKFFSHFGFLIQYVTWNNKKRLKAKKIKAGCEKCWKICHASTSPHMGFPKLGAYSGKLKWKIKVRSEVFESLLGTRREETECVIFLHEKELKILIFVKSWSPTHISHFLMVEGRRSRDTIGTFRIGFPKSIIRIFMIRLTESI